MPQGVRDVRSPALASLMRTLGIRGTTGSGRVVQRGPAGPEEGMGPVEQRVGVGRCWALSHRRGAMEPPLCPAFGTRLVPVGGMRLPGAVCCHRWAWGVQIPHGPAHSSLASTPHLQRQKGPRQGSRVLHPTRPCPQAPRALASEDRCTSNSWLPERQGRVRGARISLRDQSRSSSCLGPSFTLCCHAGGATYISGHLCAQPLVGHGFPAVSPRRQGGFLEEEALGWALGL